MGKLNDHIEMISRNGAIKPVPCWQIDVWIKGGIFSLEKPSGNDVGYDFKDHKAGVGDYKAWVEHQLKLRAQKIARSRAPQAAPGGIADAQFNPTSPPPAATGPFTTVPETESGKEEIDKGPEIEPKDVLEDDLDEPGGI